MKVSDYYADVCEKPESFVKYNLWRISVSVFFRICNYNGFDSLR